MEVYIKVPEGTSLDVLKNHYDLDSFHLDATYNDTDHYYYGNLEDEDLFTSDDCVKMCGFIDGAIEHADCCIDGDGPWAISQMGKTEEYKQAYQEGLKLRMNGGE